MKHREWLEADGLGGFASGTVFGIRTRRYHALLLTATRPPAGRIVLVNGFDASMATANGHFALSSQLYLPDILHPDGARRIVEFTHEPWPRWLFALEDGTKITQEILVVHGASIVVLCWRLVDSATATSLTVRPFLSGRDYHSLHHENPAFGFEPEIIDQRVVWNPYPGIPAIVAAHNGTYRHQPDWYRNFVYREEQERGLDFTEDLAAPGSFQFNLTADEAVLIFAANHESLGRQVTAQKLCASFRADELKRRASFASIMDRAADAYLVKRGAILTGYSRGTRYGIRMDEDGLLAAGAPGVQLTWMDAKVGDWVVTPRIGKPIEVQALWLNALWIASKFNSAWREPLTRGLENFRRRFWNSDGDYLFDVIDADHERGKLDASFRPNQIFAVGGLPLPLIDGDQAQQIVAGVERRLWTPLGLRSLAPGESGYTQCYQGGVRERDGAYHQGTVWPWLIGPFVEAWVRTRGNSAEAKREARARFLSPLFEHLNQAGLGHISEIADAEPPHSPRGCPFQAWSLAELLRLDRVVLT